jgi:type I restriction enzyme R subunit
MAMAKTDTSERWFEARVVRGLTGVPQPEYSHALAPTDFAATQNGYVQGKPTDYNRDVALDVAQLLAFLQATQPKAVETLELAADGIKRTQFLHRLQGEITKRGVVDVLRKGVGHGPVDTLISTSCCPRRATPLRSGCLRQEHLQRHSAGALQQRFRQ